MELKNCTITGGSEDGSEDGSANDFIGSTPSVMWAAIDGPPEVSIISDGGNATKPMNTPLSNKIQNNSVSTKKRGKENISVPTKKRGKENIPDIVVKNAAKSMPTMPAYTNTEKRLIKLLPKECREKGCTFTCHYLNQFRHHLTTVHKIAMEKEVLKFKNYQGTKKLLVCPLMQCYFLQLQSSYSGKES